MGEFDAAPEPTPKWSALAEKLGHAWSCHFYAYGAVLIIVSLFNFFSFIYHVVERRQRSKRISKCYATISALLLYFNLVRGLLLCIDPYNSNPRDLRVSQGTIFLFWGSTVPCFTSAFILMNLALLDITKIQLYSARLQNLKFISSILAVNFTLVLSFDLTVILNPEVAWLLYVCQAFFLLLGIAVALAMLYTGFKVVKKLKDSAISVHSFDAKFDNRSKHHNEKGHGGAKSPGGMVSGGTNVAHIPRGKSAEKDARIEVSQNVTWKSKSFRRGTRRLTIITMVTSIAAILYSLAQVYSFIAVYRLRDSTRPINPWHWFVYQTVARFLEVVMSICMSYIVRAKDVIARCRERRDR